MAAICHQGRQASLHVSGDLFEGEKGREERSEKINFLLLNTKHRLIKNLKSMFSTKHRLIKNYFFD